MKSRLVVVCLLSVVIATFGVGCASVQRGTPIAWTQIQANMDRTDYDVLRTTEGTSTEVSFFGPVYRIIDGNKISILGIKFFEDQYAWRGEQFIGGVDVESRAYYKALAATPDADAVVAKSFERSETGFFIYSKRTCTFKGKALKYKVHP